jgi:5'-3' exonuclease
MAVTMAYRILLDTSSLMYRAYFSHPPSIRNAEGRPVNALHGYLDFTTYLLGERRPDEIVHCYDHNWKPDERVALYAGYKAHRPPDPEGLPEQFAMLREVLDAFGLPQAEAPDWEGEDAIGAVIAAGAKRDRFDIVTGDRDLLQLVRDPTVRVLFTIKGVSELHEFDEAAVEAKYGMPPARYADFAILRGDPSDGLPGVRGVGEKTAKAIVQDYPSLEALVADAAAPRRTGPLLQRSPSLRASIREATEYLAAMQRVVPIRSDVPVDAWSRKPDDDRLDQLAERYRIAGPVRRLRAALAATRAP